MAKRPPFSQTAPPWVHITAAPWEEVGSLWQGLANQPGVLARFLRGRNCQKTAAFFDELAAALQFSGYFGENWDAANDCLCDLSWWNFRSAVVFVQDAGKLLKAAPASEWPKFAAVVNLATQVWNEEKARPFHLVLQAEAKSEEALLQRCQSAGLTVDQLSKP